MSVALFGFKVFFFITAWWNLQDKLPFSPFSINGRNVWVSEMFKKTFREFSKKKIFFVNRPCLRSFQNFNFFLDRIFQREIKSFSSLSTLNFRDFLELIFFNEIFSWLSHPLLKIVHSLLCIFSEFIEEWLYQPCINWIENQQIPIAIVKYSIP